MDYKRSNPGTKHPIVEIALTMLPGKGHVETGQFGISPLLINPGGPGGSGTTFVMSGGKGIQQVVGLDQDIIGFDPRGIGASTPKADCFSFPSDRGASGRPPNKAETAKGVFHMATWAMSGEAIGLFDSSDAAPRQLDSRARAFAALCGAKDEVYGDNSIFKYIGTPAVARDMLSIVDAWDAWREKEEQSDAFWTTRSKDVSLDTKGKLVYWGFSYGSFLGATFAALFPDRVGRVINDGVVDADYYVSPFWEESLLNTEDVELSFFKFCHEGGKLCAFYREGDTEQDISDRFYQALERLKEKPVIGTQDITMTPAIITWEYYRTVIFSLLYFPQNSFPILAIFMSLIANNDVSTVTQLGGWSGALLDFTPFCGMKSAPYTGKDAQGGILCGDKRYPVRIPSFFQKKLPF
jgi:pimeloyl-ACP methyl ester carboxylesterase